MIITDFIGDPVDKEVFDVTWDLVAAEKGGYEHFMLKEIHEQPEAIRATLRGTAVDGRVDFSYLGMDELFQKTGKIFIVACGTAYHAGLVGRLAIEKLARIPVETDIASEFRYRDIIWHPDDLMIVISQSGETADTKAALQEARRQGIKVLAVTNVVGSAIAREADQVIYTHAGPEIAVASTKAYTTQLLVMYLLALYLAEVRGTMNRAELEGLYSELLYIDTLVDQVLAEEAKIKQLAQKYAHVQSTFFLGRGFDYAVAMEGALKLKEVSIFMLKPMPLVSSSTGLALIESGCRSWLDYSGSSVDKTMSNLREVKARGAVVWPSVKAACRRPARNVTSRFCCGHNPFLAPIVGVILADLCLLYGGDALPGC